MRPYASTESKKEQVRTMFDSIAHRYDLLNHTLSLGIDRGWRRRVVKTVCRWRPHRVLDMATGTADLAIMLSRSCPEAHITGIDLSEEMLSIGRQKIERAGLGGRIDLQQGDAEQTGYGHEPFDVATVAFGVRNFDDLAGGLRGLYNSLRPGGLLCVLEFGLPNNPLLRSLYGFYFHRILPLLGGAVSKDKAAYRYLPLSVDEFPYGKRFADLLSGTGFSDPSVQNLMGGIAQIYTAYKPAVDAPNCSTR